jgi:TetR/AcrR family transcriptional regulator, ethionamide resistance regulator
MASLGRQSGKRAAIEAAVLEATEALLAEGATFAELNIERIATRAGISRTAFYFYFRDKRELLVRLTGEVNAELMAAADTWWSGDADMRTALQQISDIYDAHGRLLRAVVEVATYDEEVARYWRALVGRFVDATRERIEAEQRTGAALPGPAHATAFALVWMAERSFYEHRVQDEPVSSSELVDALTTVFERAIYGS